MFRTFPLSIIRSFSLYTQQWYMSYRIRIELHPDPARKLSANLKPLLCVQWKTPDDRQGNCPKHVEFHSKNKFEKLVQLFGFIIRNVSRCMITWTSNYFCLQLSQFCLRHLVIYCTGEHNTFPHCQEPRPQQHHIPIDLNPHCKIIIWPKLIVK